jgi:hypothetical protein
VKTTAKQRAAITQLKRSLTACRKSGVKLFGMDNVLYATVKYDPNKNFHQQYQEPPNGDELIEHVADDGTVYIDSGGW